ncbi:MAG: hypothetical protein GY854_21375 [Deltaproteobacteria bacterium]|nr:hypothetical protein [Deltaproteobacteria bacterium]
MMNEKTTIHQRIQGWAVIVGNLVVITGAVASAIILILDYMQPEVTATLDRYYVRGTNYVADGAWLDKLQAHQGEEASQGEKDVSLPAEMWAKIGRLDEIRTVDIHNRSDLPVDLEVRMQNRKEAEEIEDEINYLSPSQSSFVLANASSNCAIGKDDLLISEDGYLIPEEVATLRLDRFPPDCKMHLYFLHVRAPRVQIEVYYDGRKARIYRVRRFYGSMSDYVSGMYDNQPWGFITRGLLPIVLGLIVLLVFFRWALKLLDAISRRRKKKKMKESASA